MTKLTIRGQCVILHPLQVNASDLILNWARWHRKSRHRCRQRQERWPKEDNFRFHPSKWSCWLDLKQCKYHKRRGRRRQKNRVWVLYSDSKPKTQISLKPWSLWVTITCKMAVMTRAKMMNRLVLSLNWLMWDWIESVNSLTLSSASVPVSISSSLTRSWPTARSHWPANRLRHWTSSRRCASSFSDSCLQTNVSFLIHHSFPNWTKER